MASGVTLARVDAQQAVARIRRDSTVVRGDTSLVRLTESMDRLISELLQSRALEERFALALRSADERGDARRVRALTDSLVRITKRNAGLMTSMELQCTYDEPDGYMGVQLDLQPSRLDNGVTAYRLSDGAVLSVDPGSPADKAGIQPGDVLISIGGQDVRQPIALGKILMPGARVAVLADRDGARKKFGVFVAKRPAELGSPCVTLKQLIAPGQMAPLTGFHFRRPVPSRAPAASAAPPPDLPAPAPPNGFGFLLYAPTMRMIAGAQVTALDDDWRESLGVDHGLLVVRVPPGSPAKASGLRGGDVILSADDEDVSSPGALLRIVSNSSSRAVKLQIVRAGKTQALTLRWQERDR